MRVLSTQNHDVLVIFLTSFDICICYDQLFFVLLADQVVMLGLSNRLHFAKLPHLPHVLYFFLPFFMSSTYTDKNDCIFAMKEQALPPEDRKDYAPPVHLDRQLSPNFVVFLLSVT